MQVSEGLIPGRENSTCRGPGAGAFKAYQEASMMGTEQLRQRREEDEARKVAVPCGPVLSDRDMGATHTFLHFLVAMLKE